MNQKILGFLCFCYEFLFLGVCNSRAKKVVLTWNDLKIEFRGPHFGANISLETSGEELGQEDDRKFVILRSSERS